MDHTIYGIFIFSSLLIFKRIFIGFDKCFGIFGPQGSLRPKFVEKNVHLVSIVIITPFVRGTFSSTNFDLKDTRGPKIPKPLSKHIKRLLKINKDGKIKIKYLRNV